MDIYLKTDNQEIMIEALLNAGLLVAIEDVCLPSLEASIDEIGTIEGATGWHVNVRYHSIPDELLPYIITPPTVPYRVWA